jgi:hypothetical protein
MAVLADELKAHSPLPEAPSPLPEPTTWPARLQPMTVPPSERDEIKQRLANFKAHQLKMQAEREDYYSQTMTRTRELAAGLTLFKKPIGGTIQPRFEATGHPTIVGHDASEG